MLKFEGVLAPGPDPAFAPEYCHGAVADAEVVREQSLGPVGDTEFLRRRSQRHRDDLLVVKSLWPTRALLVEEPVDPVGLVRPRPVTTFWRVITSWRAISAGGTRLRHPTQSWRAARASFGGRRPHPARYLGAVDIGQCQGCGAHD